MFKELNALRYFFEEPEKRFHLRELARLMSKNPVTVKKALLPFVDKGLLGLEKERGLELYSSNAENDNYKELKKVFNLQRLNDSGLVEFLRTEFNHPVIVLFGSYERGEDNQNSDVDIFILSEISRNVDLSKFEKFLNRGIQLHVVNKKRFKVMKKENPKLINSILNGVVLNGFLEIL